MNTQNVAKISRIANVGLLSEAIEVAMERPVGLPGVVVMFGDSGLGKSAAAAYCAKLHRAYYVECRDSWTRKAFLLAVLADMGIIPANTLSEMVDQIAEELTRSGRPLIVDDVQYLLDKSVANVLTDIYNASQGVVILVGEERVPTSLARLERLHNRVIRWVGAEKSTLKDLELIASESYPDVTFDTELLEKIQTMTKGCLRRAAVNLYHAAAAAREAGQTTMGLALWGERQWFTGDSSRKEV